MTIMDILYSILILPLQLFFEVLYTLADRMINNPGLSIIVLSLAINFLVLPLYRRSDAMQEEERDIEAKLHKGVAHIKKTFKGDERMMILQTYYRQNNYKPTYVFKGSISLFLEIPFFIAAYQFLSHLEALNGVSFMGIRDLGAADGLIVLGGITINLLPIVMTAVNLVTCVIFTKGYPTKTKVQLYAMAIFFLFFLYNSPAGLVFYWTLNNVFSLVKTIFYKLKNPKKVLEILAAICGAAFLVFGTFFYHPESIKRVILVIGLGIGLILPLAVSLIKSRVSCKKPEMAAEPNRKIFFAGALLMAVLIGILIPSAVINASPQEFVDVYYYVNPLWYVVSAACYAFGTFIVWMGVFYWLASKKGKVFFDISIWILCGCTILNYMFFGKDLGILSSTLKYEAGLNFTGKQMLINIAAILVLAVAMYAVYRWGKKLVPQILLVCTIALVVMSVKNIAGINSSVSNLDSTLNQTKEGEPSFTLSKDGKNVVVIMLDRAMNKYIPYIMNEKPELKEAFAGFTYYSNTISFGGMTNFAAPALFGGYEYTPYELNKNDSLSLEEKHNQAMKLMPALFYNNGYDVTVCDPAYAGYEWTPDLTIYDEYPDMNTYITNGRFSDKEDSETVVKKNKRNFFCYGIMKAMPLCIQDVLYNDGNYNYETKQEHTEGQTIESNYVANGTNAAFYNAYTVLENLSYMTKISDDSTNTFMMMVNDVTHEPMLLQTPEYVPAENVDNTEYEEANKDRFTVDGKTLEMENSDQYIHYQTNMAALLRVGEWLEYLKENDVYDNTRIIIAADHGRPLYHSDDMVLDDGSTSIYDVEIYYPLLMVKDFDSKEFTEDEQFMTNGDVPTIALSGLIDNPVNPFTGNPVNNDEKYAHDQYILGSYDWDVSVNNGNKFLPGSWLSVHTDMRKKENWKILNKNAVSPFE